MDAGGGQKKKEKVEGKVKAFSWQQKKELADKEEEILRKGIEELSSWVDMIGNMNDEQLKEHIKSKPEELKKTKDQKSKTQVKTTGKSKSYNGIMASVWKFHKD